MYHSLIAVAFLITGCLGVPAQQAPEPPDPIEILEQLAEEFAAHREAQDELPSDVTLEGLDEGGAAAPQEGGRRR